ncbi:MAG: DUF4476 domain-containing protein [Flavisolibacter sp.]
MKTIFTLLLVTVFTSAFAYDEGKLTITVASQKNIQVYVDGRIYQANDNSFVLNNIQPGNHTIKIYKKAKRNNNNSRNDRNINNNNRNDLIYSSTVYVKPATHVDVMINRFGKAMVDEKVLSNRTKDWGDDDWNDEGGYNNGNNNGNNQGYKAMSEYDFNQLVQKIRNQWLGKMTTAKDGVNNNYLNIYQVKQILQLFSSESDKLELAKLSYKNLVDRQNFRQLYELFSYQSQTELDKYVRDYRY